MGGPPSQPNPDISNIVQLDGNVSSLSDTLTSSVSNSQPPVNNKRPDNITAALSLPTIATT